MKSTGEKAYRAPSEMLNMVCKTPEDEANFDNWCYNIPSKSSSAKPDGSDFLNTLSAAKEIAHDHSRGANQ